jgi:hypothetical protein
MLRAEAIQPDKLAAYKARGARQVSSLDLAKYRGGEEA